MAKEKTIGVFFKMSPEEAKLFDKRMAQTNISNRSAFIRKMCIDGHVFNINMAELVEIRRLLSNTANNFNQIARRVNSGGDVYPNEIDELSSDIKGLRTEFGELLTLLTQVAGAKPGKWFIPPPTIRDLPEYSDPRADTEET